MTARTLRSLFTVALLGGVVIGCSRSDDLATPEPETSTTPEIGPTDPTEVPSTAGTVPTTEGSAPTDPTSSPSTAPARPIATPVSVVEVDEVGVPGLDSDDVFCSSWSRFAGSFQVVAVTAAFGSGPPEELAALEVAAAPTVTESYDELFAVWPDELSSERDVVADEFLGPFERRAETAEQALWDAGADDATVAAISDAWLAGLAQRDPTTPEFSVDLPDETWALIDEAAAGFAAQRVPFSSDPSLVTGVETPLTSAYLATSCPDQGTLSGQEVGAP